MADIKYSTCTHVLYRYISIKPLNTIESKKCGKAKFNARISKFTDEKYLVCIYIRVAFCIHILTLSII